MAKVYKACIICEGSVPIPLTSGGGGGGDGPENSTQDKLQKFCRQFETFLDNNCGNEGLMIDGNGGGGGEGAEGGAVGGVELGSGRARSENVIQELQQLGVLHCCDSCLKIVRRFSESFEEMELIKEKMKKDAKLLYDSMDTAQKESKRVRAAFNENKVIDLEPEEEEGEEANVKEMQRIQILNLVEDFRRNLIQKWTANLPMVIPVTFVVIKQEKESSGSDERQPFVDLKELKADDEPTAEAYSETSNANQSSTPQPHPSEEEDRIQEEVEVDVDANKDASIPDPDPSESGVGAETEIMQDSNSDFYDSTTSFSGNDSVSVPSLNPNYGNGNEDFTPVSPKVPFFAAKSKEKLKMKIVKKTPFEFAVVDAAPNQTIPEEEDFRALYENEVDNDEDPSLDDRDYLADLSRAKKKNENGPEASNSNENNGNEDSNDKGLNSSGSCQIETIIPPGREKMRFRYNYSGGKYHCDVPSCTNIHSSKSGLYIHFKAIHIGIRFKCLACGKESKYKHLMYGHLRQKHQGNGLQFECEICLQRYANEGQLLRHKRETHSFGGSGENSRKSKSRRSGEGEDGSLPPPTTKMMKSLWGPNGYDEAGTN